MIHAVIWQNEREECVGFQIEGHAGYKEAGQDIVCAAVSVLTINTINAIERYTKDDLTVISDEEAGRISCRLTGSPSCGTDLLFKAMILGLSDMARDDSYATYIDLIFKEVQQP